MRRSVPTLNWVRAIVCPALVFIATSMDRGYQTDFWHHIASGREIARTGKASELDTFTFTVAGESVRDANWLTQLAYFKLYEFGGLSLVQTINSLVLASAAAMLVWICRRRGASMLLASIISTFAFLGIWQTLLIRPQSVSLLLFVAMYALLVESERRRWLLALPPVILALWANIHGGFPIGLALIGAFLGATVAERVVTRFRKPVSNPSVQPPRFDMARAFGLEQTTDSALVIRRGQGMAVGLLLCLSFGILATFLNPYGVGIYQYILTLSSRAAGRGIQEWLPPSMNLWVGRVWAASVVGLIVLLAFVPRRPRVRDLIAALCFLPLACASVRMVPWWLLMVAPVIATTLSQNLDMLTRAKVAAPRPSWSAATAFASIMGVCVLCSPPLERFNPVFAHVRSNSRPEMHIQAVVEQLPAKSRSNVFARLEWGEYLDWAAPRSTRVFMDGRIEIYPDDVWSQYNAISSAQAGWQAILDQRGVDYLLLDSTYHGQLLSRVEASTAWRPVFRSGPAVLFARRDTAEAATADARDEAVSRLQ